MLIIRDAQGRKWTVHFVHYQAGWHWTARHDVYDQHASEAFKTKNLAEANAYRTIPSHDAIAQTREYLHRLIKHEVTPS